MSYTRQQYAAICQTCTKFEFNPKLGIVCSLTGQVADFSGSCPDFEQHKTRLGDGTRVKTYAKTNETWSEVKGRRIGPLREEEKSIWNSGGWGGALMIVGGTVWIVVGLYAGYIFYYPIILIIAGIVAVIKASARKAKNLNRPDGSEILDDDKELEDL